MMTHSMRRAGLSGERGFSLLEVLAATALLAVAVTVLMQLFSAGLSSLTKAGDREHAALAAERKLRDVLLGQPFGEGETEDHDEHFRYAVSILPSLTERTAGGRFGLYSVRVTVHWNDGSKHREFTVTTLKAVPQNQQPQEANVQPQ